MKKSILEVRSLVKNKAWSLLLSSESFFHVLTSTLLLFLAFLIPILSFDYGVTWDERISIKYSQDVLNYFSSWGVDKTCLNTNLPVYNHMIFYGNVFGLLSTLLNEITPFDIVYSRHLLCSFFGFLTILYIVKHARLIKDFRLALLTLLLILFSPRFMGYIMNDFRDTTFMLGFVASTYFIHKIIKELPYLSIKNGALLTLFLWLSSGVRIGGMVLLFYFALILIFWFYKNKSQVNFKFSLKIISSFLIIALLSYSMVVAIWPWTHQSPITRPLEALMKFSDLQLILNYQVFNGQLIPNRDVPIHFLFTWIGITMPIVLLIGLAMFLLIIKKNNALTKSEFFITIIVVSIPLLLYCFQLRNLYDGWRHFLFLAPYLALFSAAGWYLCFSLIEQHKIKVSLLLVFCLLLLMPARAMIKDYPFHTLYFNEIVGGVKGAFGNYEVEMDGNSFRKATAWLNEYAKKNRLSLLKVGSNGEGLSVSAFVDSSLVSGNIIWLPEDQLYFKDWDFAIFSCRNVTTEKIAKGQWPPKESIHNITIDGISIISILKRENRDLYFGFNALKKSEFEVAISHFKNATKFQPSLVDPFRMLGIAYLKFGDFKNAESAFNNALKISKNDASLIYYIGELAYYMGNYEKAEKFVLRSKILRIENYYSDYLLANIYIRQGRIQKAKLVYTSLIDKENMNNDDKSLIYLGYGELQMVIAEQTPTEQKALVNKAIDLFTKAINFNKNNKIAYERLIDVYNFIGRNDYAEQTRKIMNKELGIQ